MWLEAPLSIYLISPPNPPLPTLETRVTKENFLSYFEAKSSMAVVAVVSGPYDFVFFFLSGQREARCSNWLQQ
jgi:hypothetical protein